MLVKINGVVVAVTKENETFGWNSIETPQTEALEVYGLLEATKDSLDLSSPEHFVQSYVAALDTTNYYFMSKSELTDFLYRFSSWGMENFYALLP